MSLPLFLAGLFGKAAAGAVAKGLAGKASAAGAKAVVGSHGHHRLAQQIAAKLAEKASDSAVKAALSRKDRDRADR